MFTFRQRIPDGSITTITLPDPARVTVPPIREKLEAFKAVADRPIRDTTRRRRRRELIDTIQLYADSYRSETLLDIEPLILNLTTNLDRLQRSSILLHETLGTLGLIDRLTVGATVPHVGHLEPDDLPGLLHEDEAGEHVQAAIEHLQDAIYAATKTLNREKAAAAAKKAAAAAAKAAAKARAAEQKAAAMAARR